MQARGKDVVLLRHAWEGMTSERPPIRTVDVLAALEEPDQDDGSQATKRRANRTILVYYEETEEGILVHGVSATRRDVRA